MTNSNLPAKQEMSINKYLHSDAVKNRFNELLGKNGAAFLSTVISLCNENSKLKECSPQSIVSAAALAATLNLPVTPSLGQAYIVPYKGKAQFQIGVKGMLQLALRSGQYQNLHVGAICEGQIKERDPFTGELIRGEKISDTVVGYVAYMELVNGYKKTLYMTVDEIEKFAVKYSPSYAYDKRAGKKSSLWSTDFDAMAKKTMLKKLLREYGIMSIDQQSNDLQKALKADQIEDEDPFTPDGEVVDIETGEILEDVIDVTAKEVADGGTGGTSNI